MIGRSIGRLTMVLLLPAMALAFSDPHTDTTAGQDPPQPREDEITELLSGTAADGEPWRISGASLSGALDGPLQVDSLIVTHGLLTVAARRGIWRPEQRAVELIGEVEFRDSARVLQAEHGFYHRDRLFLELEDDVRGRGPEGNLASDRLTYDRQEGKLALSGHVQLVEPGRELHSDWLRYDLADSFATFGGAVWLSDLRDSVDVFGDLLQYDRAAGTAVMTAQPPRRPRLLRSGDGDAPAFLVEADTLRFDNAARRGAATGSVRFTRAGLRGMCQEAFYAMERDRLLLLGAPELRDSVGVITGDSMTVALRGGLADRMTVWGGARAEYFPPGRPGEAHFTIGDSLSAYFSDGALQSLVVEREAQAFYLPAGADRQRGVGLNWTAARRIRLLLDGEGVERVQFDGQVGGRYILPGRFANRDSARAAALRDSLAGAPAPADSGFAVLRAGARAGDLMPSDSLAARFGFDPLERIDYDGEALEFTVAREQIVISEAAHVRYRAMELEAQRILFDAPRDLVLASGEPQLRDGDSEVRGERMTYRIDSRKGLVFQGRSEFEGGYYRGERVKRVAQRTFFVRDADFTTCDAEDPHFHFHANRMKVISQDRVVARPIVLYLGDIPLFAIPYAAFPIRRGRQSGLLIPDVEFGFDTDRGRFLRNVGYYYAPNDYMDALVWLDYYERDPRLAINGRYRYKLRYLLDGQIETSFTRDESYGGKSDRWLLRMSHDQVLGERFTLKASGNFQSDKDYAADRDFGASVDERVNRVLRSQLSLNKSWSNASLSLAADRTEYLEEEGAGDTRINQSAPSINFSLNSFALGVRPDDRGYGGRLPFLASTYVRASGRVRSIYTKSWDDSVVTNHAVGVSASISDKRRLLGAVNLTPSLSLNGAWAYEDRQGQRHPVGLSWRAGLAAATTLYGTFFPRLGPWEGLRHVVELSASYAYSPELPELADFPSVGGIGLSSSQSSRVSLRATQRFHIKLGSGEETRKKENLLIWSSSTSYDFLAHERARERGTEAHPWGDLSHSLRLQPGRFLSSEFSLTHDLERWQRSSLSLRTTMRLQGGQASGGGGERDGGGVGGGYGDFGDPSVGAGSGPDRQMPGSSLAGPWQLSATHVFSLGREWESRRSSVNLSAALSLTPAWRVQYSIYYDLKDDEVTSQGFSLYRDLHCWQASLDRRSSGGRSSYYFRISVKDLPDIKYERRRLE
ncbi:MAG: LPS assembly protein LptD [Candidatus Eisenbacteria bacterium]|nr:LPS assembly protein LptD [Candidatus Eisenbacteria bacterium]